MKISSNSSEVSRIELMGTYYSKTQTLILKVLQLSE